MTSSEAIRPFFRKMAPSFIYQVPHVSVLHFQRPGECVYILLWITSHLLTSHADDVTREPHTSSTVSALAVSDWPTVVTTGRHYCDMAASSDVMPVLAMTSDERWMSVRQSDRPGRRGSGAQRHIDRYIQIHKETVIIRTRPRRTTCSRRVSCVLRSSEGTQTPR